MLKVSEVVTKFQAEGFEQFSLLPKGDIAITVRGCLHGWIEAAFSPFCEFVTCGFDMDANGPTDDETWLVRPTWDKRAELLDVLTRAWRQMSAHTPLPELTFTNVNKPWEGVTRKPTSEQVKTALILLQLGHSVRPLYAQGHAFDTGYGVTYGPEDEYIALDVDHYVFLLAGSGFLGKTALQTNAQGIIVEPGGVNRAGAVGEVTG